jgi:hypothetical protein
MVRPAAKGFVVAAMMPTAAGLIGDRAELPFLLFTAYAATVALAAH